MSADTEEAPAPGKLSKAEANKENSRFLRGTIAAELQSDAACFNSSNGGLLKFHGTYQQDDRDQRTASTTGGKSDKAYMFMVRSKIPGGRLTSAQLLAELDLGDELGNDTLRITSRQGLQLHGVLKQNLKAAIARINEIQLSTLGACGDVNRNVMCCPAPYKNPVYRQVQALSDELASRLAPQTGAYHEIWLRDLESGDEHLAAGGSSSRSENEEPIYGKFYLPRKFKIGIGLPHDNCSDLYANDLGLLAVLDGDRIVGYNLLVGGGQGVTPANKKTFPAVARRMAFVPADRAADAAIAVVKAQRDHGNRVDRKQARLKYVLHEKGVAWFKERVEEHFGAAMADPDPTDVVGFNDHIGWDEQGDGRWFYGLNIENGRILDNDSLRLKTALREICRRYSPGIRLTSHQSLIFTDVEPNHRAEYEAILKQHGVKLSEEISTVRRYSMACVAWPTCGLSITESERALPGVIDHIEVELSRLGLDAEKFTVRMTGCPNGCARPYNCDVGLVGKARDRYTLLLGGRLLGDRLNFIYKDLVPTDDVARELAPVFAYFKQERHTGETFGDFCHRKGKDDLSAWAEGYQKQVA